jgi:hypothetical protein
VIEGLWTLFEEREDTRRSGGCAGRRVSIDCYPLTISITPVGVLRLSSEKV